MLESCAALVVTGSINKSPTTKSGAKIRWLLPWNFGPCTPSQMQMARKIATIVTTVIACRGKVVGVLHGEQIGKAFQIRVTKRCNTFGKNASVDRTEEQPETADQYTEQCSVLEQVDKRQRNKDDECIVEISQCVSAYKAACREKGTSGNAFDHEAQQTG